ncbi:hypothetical protein TRFO_32449 [Tritrichomonas foetus]|uniref:Trafficking protein particle complex subunit n=1 Tax=Tritrichomonas foetus TaxID=1144522 RepID=A0A1J4JNY8_9EUKA|nr:hypothetical protein TRFO_32449 [Tritrichomonas foetus]|eukprot:OHT00763.1 hypothetical protein TRFO_32449 [Tritrichomonas foetus]
MFAVVGDNNLLFSTEISQLVENATEKSYLFQFILYASLDSLDLKDPTQYRESIDTYESYSISAFVTPGQTTFLLLHPKKKSEIIRKFFHQVHSYYAQLLMNPFYDVRTPIEDEQFKKNVQAAAQILIS